ncbi:MAG: ATP-dependent Clp protease ATP-binding subunit [Candidatus Sungbacteria bacterium]|nr:ATP-dependent Clp protease ATP-binding subunit [Candidatus Sungbacteria bacterium]
MSVLIVEMFFANRHSSSDPLREEVFARFAVEHFGFDYTDGRLQDDADISQEDVETLKRWFFAHEAERQGLARFWTKESLSRVPPLGMDWASGYTPMLDAFSHVKTRESSALDEHFLFTAYKEYIDTAERILAASGEHNVLLVGEEGIGKRLVLQGLEYLIETGRALPSLAYKRFIWLDGQALLSGVTNTGMLRERLQGAFEEAIRAGNIVLGMERFHSMLDPAFPEVADILIPFLQSENLQLVATTNPRSLATLFETRKDLLALFHQVGMREPSFDQTMNTLLEIASSFEKRAGICITYPALKTIIQEAGEFSESAPPQRDVLLLNEAVSLVTSQARKRLERQDVFEVLHQRTGIPFGDIQANERDALLSLETTMQKDVIGQTQAVSVVADALRRARARVSGDKRPAGSFLFLGPTGVGKTTVAKVLAKTMFGDAERMLRFDMSEFQQIEDVKRLIGYQEAGRFQGGVLTEAVRQHPFSLLLFDEIEKAHPDILHLFLQMLDEGFLTDGGGSKISFHRTLIVCTSNAGSEFIRTHVGEVGQSAFAQTLLDAIQKMGIFRPEFLNRFDAVVAFKPLGKTELLLIARLMLKDFANQLKKEHNITLTISDELVIFLSDKGFHEEYGARPMRRVLQDTLESWVAKKLLQKAIKRGETISISPSEFDDQSRV